MITVSSSIVHWQWHMVAMWYHLGQKFIWLTFFNVTTLCAQRILVNTAVFTKALGFCWSKQQTFMSLSCSLVRRPECWSCTLQGYSTLMPRLCYSALLLILDHHWLISRCLPCCFCAGMWAGWVLLAKPPHPSLCALGSNSLTISWHLCLCLCKLHACKSC